MKVVICKDSKEVGKKAYDILKDVVEHKPNCVLGLATGSSPEGLYEEMIVDFKAKNISFADVSSFNLDEYVGIDATHEQSYSTFMHKTLFDHIDMKEENIHLPFGSTKADCEAYEKAMGDVSLDLQVLGIGRNGHIGFNEPGTSFDTFTHIVDLDEKTIQDNSRYFDGDINQVPKQAISMGIATIMKSKRILLIAMGENKADAVYGLVEGPITEDLPASVLQNHPDVTVVVDQAAASKLK